MSVENTQFSVVILSKSTAQKLVGESQNKEDNSCFQTELFTCVTFNPVLHYLLKVSEEDRFLSDDFFFFCN